METLWVKSLRQKGTIFVHKSSNKSTQREQQTQASLMQVFYLLKTVETSIPPLGQDLAYC